MQCLCICTWQNKPTEIELIGVHSLIGILPPSEETKNGRQGKNQGKTDFID